MKAYIKPTTEAISLAETITPLCNTSFTADSSSDETTTIVASNRHRWEDSEEWEDFDEE